MAAPPHSFESSGPSEPPFPEQIKLSVVEWEGHLYDKKHHHPQNLLVSGTEQYYCSLSTEERRGKNDWIIFQHEEQQTFIPTAVVIWNHGYTTAIKEIVIDGGSNSVEFQRWIKIKHIKSQLDGRQWFSIGAVKGEFAAKQMFTFFRLRVLGNQGDWRGHNCFFEFALFGTKVDAMSSYLKQHGMYQIYNDVLYDAISISRLE